MGGASAPSGREPSDWACAEEAARSPGDGAVGGTRELGEEGSQRPPGLCTALPADTCCGPTSTATGLAHCRSSVAAIGGGAGAQPLWFGA